MPEQESHRLVEIVGEALHRPPHERAAFLLSSCPDDSIRAEALSLIAAMELAGGFMERPTRADANSPLPGDPLSESIGSMVGRYRLLEQIGEGGFGVVFVAEQTEPVRRRVALKVVKFGMDSRAVVARFEHERQALAVMDHPNIARVLDAGATAAGRPFFVMELVNGRPITSYCDAANLTILERLDLFTQVCSAVQHAHSKGIIHRDIKPGNVLVVAPDVNSGATCKVIDFGIAKATQLPFSEKTAFTELRQLIGTPEYMSPEQAAGTLDVDTRSDVYSLGVLLYELLSGSTPFDPERLRSAAYGEMQRIIREVDPPAPSTRLSHSRDTLASVAAMRRTEPRKLGSMIRGELDWIVMRALDKDRSRRYDSPGALAADLRRFLAAEPVEAAPASAAYRARKFVRRHRIGVGWSMAIVLALAAGMAIALWQAGIASRERDAQHAATLAAVAAKNDAEHQRKQTNQVADFQAAQLADIDAPRMGRHIRDLLLADAKSGMQRARVPPDEVALRQQQLARLLDDANLTNVALGSLDQEVFQKSLAAVDKRFEQQPAVRARLLQSLATALTQVGLLDRAEAPQAQALSLRRRTLGEDHPDTLDSIVQSAILARTQGKLPEAEGLYREALGKMRRVLGQDDRQTISTTNNLAELLQLQGRLADAEPLYRAALANGARVLGPDDPDTIAVRNNLGFLFYAQGRLAEAEIAFRDSLASSRRVRGQSDEGTLAVANNLASVLQAQGKLSDAETIFRDSLGLSRQARGDDHPATLQFLNNMGSILFAEGQLAASEPFTREALARRRRILGDDHWDTLQSMNNMGQLLQEQGHLDAAESLFREALDHRKRILGATHQATLQSMNSLATLLQREGRLDAADPYFRDSLAKRRETLGNDHPDTLQALMGLAGLLVAQGKPADAEPLMREALAGREAKFGPDSQIVAATRTRLGETLSLLSRFSEAQTALLNAEHITARPDAPAGSHSHCVEALISLYRAWDAAEPGSGHDQSAKDWESRPESAPIPPHLSPDK